MVEFPEEQYFPEDTDKHQVVLHHTASGRGASGDYGYWQSTDGRIATCCVIDHGGVVHQSFHSKYWGYHIGAHHANNIWLQKHSIGIEIDSWGQLRYRNGKFYSWADEEVPEDRVVEYPDGFCSHRFFERYTARQIETVQQLLLHWHIIYGIPLDYHPDMWDVSEKALGKEAGIWTHVSYRSDKVDCHPQPELIEMLKNLKKEAA